MITANKQQREPVLPAIVKEDTSYLARLNHGIVPIGFTEALRKSGLPPHCQDAVANLASRAYDIVCLRLLGKCYQTGAERGETRKQAQKELQLDARREFFLLDRMLLKFIGLGADSHADAERLKKRVKPFLLGKGLVRIKRTSFAQSDEYGSVIKGNTMCIPIITISELHITDAKSLQKAVRDRWSEPYVPHDTAHWERLRALRISTPLDTPGHIRVYEPILHDPTNPINSSFQTDQRERILQWAEGLRKNQYLFKMSLSLKVRRSYNGLVAIKKDIRKILYDQHWAEWLAEIDVHATHPAITVAYMGLLSTRSMMKRNAALRKKVSLMRSTHFDGEAALWYGGALYVIRRDLIEGRVDLFNGKEGKPGGSSEESEKCTIRFLNPSYFLGQYASTETRRLVEKVCGIEGACPHDYTDPVQIERSERFWRRVIVHLKRMFRSDFYKALTDHLGVQYETDDSRRLVKKMVMKLLHGKFDTHMVVKELEEDLSDRQPKLDYDPARLAASYRALKKAIVEKFPEYYFALRYTQWFLDRENSEKKELDSSKRNIGFSRYLFQVEVETLRLAVSCLRSIDRSSMTGNENTVGYVLNKTGLTGFGRGQSILTCYDAIFINKSNAMTAKKIYECCLRVYGLRTYCKIKHSPLPDQIPLELVQRDYINKLMYQDAKGRWCLKIGRRIQRFTCKHHSDALEQAIEATVFTPATTPALSLALKVNPVKRRPGKPTSSLEERIRRAREKGKQLFIRHMDNSRHRFNILPGETDKEAVERLVRTMGMPR